MRLFWLGVLVLVAATAAVFLWPSGSEEPSIGAVETPASWSPDLGATGREEPGTATARHTPAAENAGPETNADPTPVVVETLAAERPTDLSPPAMTTGPAALIDEAPAEHGAATEAVQIPPSEPEAIAVGSEGEGPGTVPTGEEVTHEPIQAAATESAEPRIEEVKAAKARTEEPDTDEPGTQESETQVTGAALAGSPEAEPIAAAEPAPVDPEIAAPTPPAAPAPAARETAPPAVQETETGLLLAGRWNVPGRGTDESPFVLNWDMLVAVQREYEPRLGKDTVPEWVAALNGKRVAIEGYALLPIGGGSMSELLVMMNQWDGCCIGVPPSPYDAIEVRLKDRLAPTATQTFGQGGAVAYGRLTGTFQVDAYIVQGWLLGLYLLNDAKAELFGPAGAP